MTTRHCTDVFSQTIAALLLLISYEYNLDSGTAVYLHFFQEENRSFFILIRVHFTTFWTCKSSVFDKKKPRTVVTHCKNTKHIFIHIFWTVPKRYRKNPNGSEFRINYIINIMHNNMKGGVKYHGKWKTLNKYDILHLDRAAWWAGSRSSSIAGSRRARLRRENACRGITNSSAPSGCRPRLRPPAGTSATCIVKICLYIILYYRHLQKPH